MRHLAFSLSSALLFCAPLLTQTPSHEKAFYLDVHQYSPSMEGHFQGLQDGKALNVDLKQDLSLDKDGSKLGFAAEYQGPRFGVEFAMDPQTYRGAGYAQKDISIDGKHILVGTHVNSNMKVTAYTFNWTIRFMQFQPVWVGVDLGARVWDVDLSVVTPPNPMTGIAVDTHQKFPLPIPQIGLSMGVTAFDDRLVGRGYCHLLTYKGANYTHLGADVRGFILPWLGLRVFVDNESFDAPKGSVTDDLEANLDRNGAGFGVIVRF